ncbi:MAG: NADH:flavin oxidoreductase/NADH oxidase [Betaproteobacteria bacterium]|nr:NADH:flavin oxidoreductase/NADH oxidase [Betaproteobacteria bacterium]
MEVMLFSPLQLREVRLRNRIVLSPMLTYSAMGGYVNDSHLVHLGKFAAGGTGLVFVESTKVDPRGCTTPRDLGLWKDDFIDGMRQVAGLIKSYGAVAGIQLGHSGRKARRSVPWEGRAPLDQCPGVDHGEEWELIGPSPIAHSEGYAPPRAMTREDIREVAQAWGQAARRADQAGFDVVEIHGGHGYLIHQFLSPTANRRTDEYGGSLENRMRFAAEVAREVRRSWPAGKPLFFRISAVDESEWKIEDSVALAKVLKASGVDVIDCSSGGMSAQSITERSAQYGYQVEYSRRVRAGAEVKTMAVGLIVHSDQAEDILRTGSADLVALGRELLHSPNWPVDAAQKLGIESPFAQISPVYGYWLEKRARSNFGNPSTWQRGLHSLPDDAA